MSALNSRPDSTKPLKTPMTFSIRSTIFLPPASEETSSDRHVLQGLVRIVWHLTPYDFLNEQVLQDRHFETMQHGAFMRFDEWFWVADHRERGFRGLGKVL